MIIMNLASGNHYIGTNFNGLMVDPVNIEEQYQLMVIMLLYNK